MLTRHKVHAASVVGVPARDDESVGATPGKDALKARAAQTTAIHELPFVLLLPDLAKLLRCSTRTLERRIRAGADLPPELPRIDSTHRWYRPTVEAWMARTKTAQAFKAVMGGRR